MFNFDYLKKVSQWEAKKTMNLIEDNKIERSIHRTHRNGFTNDKAKSGRRSARIPIWVLANPEYAKYFDKEAPVEDRRREMENFLNLPYIRTPWGEKISPKAFLLVDRL